MNSSDIPVSVASACVETTQTDHLLDMIRLMFLFTALLLFIVGAVIIQYHLLLTVRTLYAAAFPQSDIARRMGSSAGVLRHSGAIPWADSAEDPESPAPAAGDMDGVPDDYLDDREGIRLN